MNIENVIFDFDGTLVDTADDVVACLRKAYQSVLPARTVDVRPTHIGPQLKEIINNITPGLGPEVVHDLMRNFRHCYDNSSYPNTQMRGHIDELLKLLKNLSVGMFIVTNKPKRATQRILKALHLACFREVVTPDFFPGKIIPKDVMIAYLVGAYQLEPDRTLMVGDSESDIAAARQNGIAALILLDGYGNREAIRHGRPEYQLEKASQLYSFMRGLLKNGPRTRVS